MIYYILCLLFIDYLNSTNIIVERHSGIDIVLGNQNKIKSADVYVDKRIYFFVVLENGRSSLKALNYSQNGPKQLVDVLQFPVQSAQTVAVDWVNGNLYWADKINRFFEVVDLNHGPVFPLGKQRRRILFSQEMADIDSMVVDPWEQYIFWLHIGSEMVIERAKLNGQDRKVICRSIQYKSSLLAIDQHTKMLFWLGLDATIHRIDYQGRTGCRMHLEGDWKNWKPSFLVFSESRLIFIANGAMWTTVFSCGSGTASHIDADRLPAAIVSVGYQLARPGKATSQCTRTICHSICLPSNESHYQCECSTGINLPTNNASCPVIPSKSLFIGSPPRIYQLSLDVPKNHMDPLYEDAGIPFQMAYDSVTSSIFYVDYNSSSIHVLPIFGYKPSQVLIFDSPVIFQAPATFAIDSPSRNIYWMNYQTSEVWVAQISPSYRLMNAAMLLSLKADSDSLSANRLHLLQRGRPQILHGELAVDSNHRFLFVSAFRDGVASIERYWLDGTNKFVVLHSPRIMSPRGITLDSLKEEIFFVDMAKDVLMSVGYNGNDFRVIAKKFSDFFGLTFLDGFLYWTDLETLTVNKIRSDGMARSTVVNTHNLRTATMPIVAMSSEFNSTTGSPCTKYGINCDQLCFPTHGTSDSYSCGCANPAKVLLNKSRCTRKGIVVLLFNSSFIKLQHILSSRDRTPESVFELSSDRPITSVQIDRFRNIIYWIDKANNCIMKTPIGTQLNTKSKIFCLTTDTITSISIDSNRNNLYVSIRSPIWPRIELIRLPFSNAELIWRKVLVSIPKESSFIGAITVHTSTERIFWITGELEELLSVVRVYQADLDGSRQLLLWSGTADIDELVLDDKGMHIFWKCSHSGKIFKFDIMTSLVHDYPFPYSVVNNTACHIYATDGYLYLSQNSSLFQINLTLSQNSITGVNMQLFLNISSPQSLNGFAIFPHNISSKVALIKSDLNLGSVVMCPNEARDSFSVCSQICLPSAAGHCSCGSPYSLMLDGSTCLVTNNHLLVLTSSGEVIGLEMKLRQDRPSQLLSSEWIEIPESQPQTGQRFIDAVFWTSKNIVLLLDNEGQLIGKHRSWLYQKNKIYKQLSIMKETNDPLKISSTYEKAYKHFLAKDQTDRDQYESSRFSIALDPISDTLIWSDWVNGVIVTERLNNNHDTVDYLGIVVDFRHSSRRPLKVAVSPISSSLIWISADLSLTGSNDSSIWRQFWIELSDMDGSRRTVLVKDPGVPSCLTVDVHTGRVYWIDKRSKMLMYLYINWDTYQMKAGHILGRRLKVTVGSFQATGIDYSSSAMTVLKKHLVWADWFRQIVASASLDQTDVNIQAFEFPYAKHKLKNVVKILDRLVNDDFRISSVGSLLQNHPCSHEATDVNGLLCSHLCLSTIPISLAEEHSLVLTLKQLVGKYRCACPHDMSVQYPHKQGSCLKTSFFRCEKNEVLCRAGRFFDSSEKLVTGNCLSMTKQCDTFEDCLDGSDETGCSHCNSSHAYSCSASGLCMDIKKRCDGTADCDSDELCCDSQKFECLTGSGPSRCIAASERCDGNRNCADGSDEAGCYLSGRKDPSNNDLTIIKNIRDNHLVAIVTGCVAVLAVLMAIVYIFVSRRKRNKTIHESCMFRTNNVNIMLMSNSSRTPRHSRPPRRSHHSMSHAQSCEIIEIYKSQHDSDQLTHSLTSLSDIYQRIRDPYPDKFAALKIPLFTIQDDVLFNFNRFRRVQDQYTSSESNERFDNPPPSEVTEHSEESVNCLVPTTANEDSGARCSDILTPCESELEEIYFHRYRTSTENRSPNYQNYPSRLLQMLLTSNHSNYLQDSSHSTRQRTSQPKYDQQRRKKLFKHQQKRRKVGRRHLSLSPRRKLYCSHESLSAQTISPPPPSPITVVST